MAIQNRIVAGFRLFNVNSYPQKDVFVKLEQMKNIETRLRDASMLHVIFFAHHSACTDSSTSEEMRNVFQVGKDSEGVDTFSTDCMAAVCQIQNDSILLPLLEGHHRINTMWQSQEVSDLKTFSKTA